MAKNNAVLTQEQKDNKQKEIDKIKEQIEAFESKLTALKITKLVRSTHKVGITGGPELSLPGAMCWESHSMNCLTWSTDCKHIVDWAR